MIICDLGLLPSNAMSVFDLDGSMERAKALLGDRPPRRLRQDRGRSRLAPELLAELQRSLASQERPSVATVSSHLKAFADARGLRPPSRATLYQFMSRTPAGRYPIAALPATVRATLYNLSDDGEVLGHQLVFYCFNYGDLEARSFASGLPWLALYQAVRMRGWRRRSRTLLMEVLTARGI